MQLFPEFPDASYLRIFAGDRALTSDECSQIEASSRDFVAAWRSHEQQVSGDFSVVEGRFLVFASSSAGPELSGCSKDSIVGQVRLATALTGVRFVDAPPICFRDREGQIQGVSRDAFARMARQGEVDDSTPVFDLTIQDLGALRAGSFELPAGKSWHAQAFALQAV